MRGVIMETENGRAVLLTKGGGFVNIRDKGYSVGDKVNITSNTGRLCAMAASFVIVCAGVSSYFMPAGYVSVDINPSLMMTLNLYNRVIDVETFNDDARVLLDKTDIKGKSAEKSVEMLIKASEEIGYINDNNRDVILEVVPVIKKPNIDGIKHKNIYLTNEVADRETLRVAQNIGVSIAKAKAIEEYTEKNGGDVRLNAAKFNDKSVKEIRNIMRDKGHLPDKKISDMPSENPKPQERKHENIQEPQQENKKQNEYKVSENISLNISRRGGKKSQEITQAMNEPPHRDIIQKKQPLQIEIQEKDDNILQRESVKEKPSVDSKPIQTEQKPQGDTVNQTDKPQKENSKPHEPVREDNKPSDNKQQITEQKPQDSVSNQGGKNQYDKPTQSDGQNSNVTIQSDNQPPTEQKPNVSEQGKDKTQDNPTAPAEPKHEGGKEQGSQPPQAEPKHENNAPPQAGPKPQENTQNNAPQTNVHPSSEQKHESGKEQDKQPSDPKPSDPKLQNDGGHHTEKEGMGGHNDNREMP